MMTTRYKRNRIYLTEQEQEVIKDYPIILAGSGIGSVIAECALRLGFENITIIDGDHVELSNLNRQNFSENDLSIDKAEALKKRLEAINSNAKITIHNCYLVKENIETLLAGSKVAINALDFGIDSNIPLFFDEICKQKNINVIHPYNLGWGGLVTVITPTGLPIKSIAKPNEKFNELNMVEYASSYLKFWGTPHSWIDEIIEKYKNEEEDLSPPQLSVGSWMVAAMCTDLLYKIATNKKVKEFPEFYLSTLMND